MMRRVPCGLTVLLLAMSSPAAGDDSDPIAEARALYSAGVEHVEKAQFADALAAFEKSAQRRPHATTTFNIGACERALGRYARARLTLQRALEESEAAGGQMAPGLVTDAQAFLAQIDEVLARATVTIVPAEATLAVDGRPLELRPPPAGTKQARPMLTAGTLPPGAGTRPPSGTFDLVLDPGAHVFTIRRTGFAESLVNKTFAPGSKGELRLELERLPATLRVSSTKPGAIVAVDEVDVGPAPVDVLRPAGAYRVVVRKTGFLPYQSQVVVKAGEEVKLRATLLEDKPALTERWWFWAAAGTVVAGGVVLTYALTRPDPEPPPYDGGSTGWVVTQRHFRF